MSIKLTFTAAAILAVLAGPALAGDHDVATELRAPGVSLPSGAFASAARPVRGRAPKAFASAARPARIQAPSAFVTTPASANDFQLQGR
jgi:hypothetical protein